MNPQKSQRSFGRTPRAFASRRTLRADTLRLPLSRELTYVQVDAGLQGKSLLGVAARLPDFPYSLAQSRKKRVIGRKPHV